MSLFNTDYLPAPQLPPRRTTPNTIKPSASGPMKFCSKCGEPLIEGKEFCAGCGAPKATSGKIILPLPAPKLKGADLVAYVNDWIAQNPYLYNLRFDIDFEHWRNDFDRVGSTVVKQISVSYSVSDRPVSVQYGLAFLYRYKATLNVFGQMKYKGEDLVREWNGMYPDVKVITWNGGKTTTDNGVFEYYQFVTFTKSV